MVIQINLFRVQGKMGIMSEVVFVNTIVFVRDITVSTKFYSELLGLKIMNSYPTIVWFENNLAIHDAKALYDTVYKIDLPAPVPQQGKNNIDIYFECKDLKELYNRLKQADVEFIHHIEKQAWEQKVIRFYDPDRHIVEIGEPFRVDFTSEKRTIRY
jgi:catechol 2,3-dioxygenase-like lactoylglutathione lyase family enzyme